ncbi:unnamed protein product [Durusdinium trenchii]|uniref:RING-type domain-containing protein n=1 Tax=Durusdinium trenchii TaxID=1381693 RepID=A0ABP0R4R7_9DINO
MGRGQSHRKKARAMQQPMTMMNPMFMNPAMMMGMGMPGMQPWGMNPMGMMQGGMHPPRGRDEGSDDGDLTSESDGGQPAASAAKASAARVPSLDTEDAANEALMNLMHSRAQLFSSKDEGDKITRSAAMIRNLPKDRCFESKKMCFTTIFKVQNAVTAMKAEPMLSDGFINALSEAQGYQEVWMVEHEPKARGRGAKAVAAERAREVETNRSLPEMMRGAQFSVAPVSALSLQGPPPHRSTVNQEAPARPPMAVPVRPPVAPNVDQMLVELAAHPKAKAAARPMLPPPPVLLNGRELESLQVMANDAAAEDQDLDHDLDQALDQLEQTDEAEPANGAEAQREPTNGRQEEEDINICIICRQALTAPDPELGGPQMLHCGHTFHAACLAQTWRIGNHAQGWCPFKCNVRAMALQAHQAGSNPPQLVSKQATMDALNQKVKSIQQREQEIERRFEETSKLVDRSTLGAVADFPVNDEGQIYVAGAEAEMEQLQQELNHFYTIDDQCGGRSQRVWAHYLSVAFPWMAGWCINSMLLALLMRAVHHRRCGHCWLQYIEFFCGQGNLSKQALRKGWQGVSLDQEVNQSHDLLEPHGLELWRKTRLLGEVKMGAIQDAKNGLWKAKSIHQCLDKQSLKRSKRSGLAYEAVLLCMEKFEALREACQKICNLLGDRLIIQPLKNLWCDLTTLRVLVNLSCGGGSLLDEGNPLAWSEIPAHLVQCPESIPLPTKQLQLKALWRQRWTQIVSRILTLLQTLRRMQANNALRAEKMAESGLDIFTRTEEKKRALEIMMARETPESVPAFMENWEAIKKELRYFARVHKLPAEWSNVMSRKNWATLSEEAIHKGIAALNFLRHYSMFNLAQEGVRIQSGQLSKFAMELTIMCNRDEFDEVRYIGFSLGSADWAVLFWPLQRFSDGSGKDLFYLDPAGTAEWKFLLSPQRWQVVDHEVVVESGKIFMAPTTSQPLLKAFFGNMQCQKSVTIPDMALLAEVLTMPEELFNVKRMRRDQLLHALVDKIGANDEPWVKKTKELMQTPIKRKNIGDVLDELVLSEMPLEEQREFREVAEEIQSKKQTGWSIVEQKWRDSAVSGPDAEIEVAAPVVEPRVPEVVAPAVAEPNAAPEALAPDAAEVAVLDGAPQPPAAGAAPGDARPDPAPRGPRAAGRGFINVWTDVQRSSCSSVAGQIKLDPFPGSRDAPTWFMRIKQADGSWASKFPGFRRRTTHVIGESEDFPVRLSWFIVSELGASLICKAFIQGQWWRAMVMAICFSEATTMINGPHDCIGAPPPDCNAADFRGTAWDMGSPLPRMSGSPSEPESSPRSGRIPPASGSPVPRRGTLWQVEILETPPKSTKKGTEVASSTVILDAEPASPSKGSPSKTPRTPIGQEPVTPVMKHRWSTPGRPLVKPKNLSMFFSPAPKVKISPVDRRAQEPPGVESDPAQCGAQGWVRGSDLKEVKESTPEREPPTDGSVAEALTVSLPKISTAAVLGHRGTLDLFRRRLRRQKLTSSGAEVKARGRRKVTKVTATARRAKAKKGSVPLWKLRKEVGKALAAPMTKVIARPVTRKAKLAAGQRAALAEKVQVAEPAGSQGALPPVLPEEATRLAPGKEPPMRMILAKEDAMKTSRVVMPLIPPLPVPQPPQAPAAEGKCSEGDSDDDLPLSDLVEKRSTLASLRPNRPPTTWSEQLRYPLDSATFPIRIYPIGEEPADEVDDPWSSCSEPEDGDLLDGPAAGVTTLLWCRSSFERLLGEKT